MLNTKKIRQDFPILKRKINGYPLAYLDNAATSQKPVQVIEALSNYYQNHNANVNRGVHKLSEEATQIYEDSRRTVAEFIGARADEIIFVRNTTEALNLVVYGWGMKHLKKDDEVILTQMEHHSNIVPWQMLAQKIGIKLKFIEVDQNGELNLNHKIEKGPCGAIKLEKNSLTQDVSAEIEVGGLKDLITDKTRFVSLVHISNTLGTINPISKIIKQVKKINRYIMSMNFGKLESN